MEELTYEELLLAVKNLVLNALEIYNLTFNKIMPNKETKSIEKYINKLKYFKKKEENILNYIFASDCSYDEDACLNKCLYEFIDDDRIRSLIYTRLDNCFYTKTEERLAKELEEDDEEYEYEEENSHYEQIFHFLSLEYLASTSKEEEINKGKYIFSYTNPKIENELLVAHFNTENLVLLPSKINAQIIGIDKETYENEESEVCVECIVNIINEIEDGLHFNETSNFDIIGFFASKLDCIDLNDIKDICLYKKTQVYDPKSKEIVSHIIKIVDNYMTKNPVKQKNTANLEETYENEDTLSFEEKEIDVIFDLLKIETRMYDIINSLYALEVNGKEKTPNYNAHIKILKKLKAREEMLITILVVDKNLKDTIKELLDTCLNIFSADKNIKNYDSIFKDHKGKAMIIKRRILNLFKENKSPKASLYAYEKLPVIIENGQYLEAFKIYNKYIKIKKNPRPWIQLKYQKIFESSFLLDEFLANNGDLEKNTWYSDDILYQLLDISEDEYQGDKNQILFDMAENVIVDLYCYATKEDLTPVEQADSKFNLYLLKSIIKHLDEEEIELLKEDSQYTDENYKFQKQLSKIFTKEKERTTNKN